MIEAISDLLSNEDTIKNVSRFFILYLLVLWILFPIWVYMDARKRYDSVALAALFFIFILPFNLPGFIFYIIIRPEHHDELGGGTLHSPAMDGVVNIPMVNFVGDKGIEMSLSLAINSSILHSNKDINMNINLEGVPESEKVNISTDEEKQVVIERIKPKVLVSSLKNKVGSVVKEIKSFIKNEEAPEIKIEIENAEMEAEPKEEKKDNKKKKEKEEDEKAIELGKPV